MKTLGYNITVFACLWLTAGCSGQREATRHLETATLRSQADAIVHTTQTELTTLRRDLAAARIATSRQEGEAEDLRRKLAVLEADRSELRKMLGQTHSALTALQAEQDGLKQTLAEAQSVSIGRQTSPPPVKPDETDVQAGMKELKALMVMLSDELSHLKQRFSNNARTAVLPRRESSEHLAKAPAAQVVQDQITRSRIVPSASFLPQTEPEVLPVRSIDLPPRQGVIRIQPGDSLWKLAHDHATTVGELKRINGLTTDVVQAGQRLLLPSLIPARLDP